MSVILGIPLSFLNDDTGPNRNLKRNLTMHFHKKNTKGSSGRPVVSYSKPFNSFPSPRAINAREQHERYYTIVAACPPTSSL